MMAAWVLGFVALKVSFYLNDAQTISNGPSCYMVSRTTFYEQIKDELFSQFASVVDEIRTLSVQNRLLADQVSILNEQRAKDEQIIAKITSDVSSIKTQLSNVSTKLTAFASRFENRIQGKVR